ncbi:MAG: hypothetical protein GC147_09365 [Porphyrobacter sp.]|nr:hypothetical protein [Porphyrobacter sp.]
MNKPRIIEAIEQLQAGRRDLAVDLLHAELEHGPASGDRFASLARLAKEIGEIGIAMEALRRHAAGRPGDLEAQLRFWGELVEHGRTEEALALAERLPESMARHPSIAHFRGTVASQGGDFAEAERCLRIAIGAGFAPQSWHALAMIKKFAPGDRDLAAMEALLPHARQAGGRALAIFAYALGKAYDDCGDLDRAFALYDEGARVRGREEPYEPEKAQAATETLIREFSAEHLGQLAPSRGPDTRAIFVTGLPRSGTTLTEQILTAHPLVGDGGEINLFRPVLTSAVGIGYDRALAYQRRLPDDPWGRLGRAYERVLDVRFETAGRVVDKTLLQSHHLGLLLHTFPQARVIWLRRNPADVALSCYRTYFATPIPWTWSLRDIAHFMRLEDQRYAHWSRLFPDRILTLPYEELVRDPADWVARIAAFVGLPADERMLTPHLQKRAVRTASVAQVRAPIGTGAIDRAARYGDLLQEFRAAYEGG